MFQYVADRAKIATEEQANAAQSILGTTKFDTVEQSGSHTLKERKTRGELEMLATTSVRWTAFFINSATEPNDPPKNWIVEMGRNEKLALCF